VHDSSLRWDLTNPPRDGGRAGIAIGPHRAPRFNKAKGKGLQHVQKQPSKTEEASPRKPILRRLPLRPQAGNACGLVAKVARGRDSPLCSVSSRSVSDRSSAEVNPRLALSPDEAAASIGVSRDFFDEHVAHELRVVRRGRRKMIPVRELEKWLERAAGVPIDAERRPTQQRDDV
jgi:excisionase family DNA binding protein